MEGLLRRELELAGASLDNVLHANDVQFEFSLPDNAADALIIRLNDAGHGRITWITPDDAAEAR